MKIKKPFKTYTHPKEFLWKLISEYIRKKYAVNGWCECVCCGKPFKWDDIDCGHFISKNKGLSIYFYERNLAPSCKGCNRYQAGNLPGFARWLLKTYGEGIFDELIEQSKKTVKYNEYQYTALIQEYKLKIKQLKI